MMKLSIVSTLYCSEDYVDEFYQRISKEAQKITNDYEIIFVNDGSPDHSLDRAVSLYKNDSRVRVVDLSRNFGHHKAIMSGLQYTQGDYVFLLDVDLEEEPELLGKFWSKMIHGDPCVDVVYGVQNSRKGGVLERISGWFFYRFFEALSSVKVPRNIATCRLMTRQYNEMLLRYQEHEVFIDAIWMDVGLTQVPLVFDKHSHSESTYTFRKKLSLAVNAITSFSNKPLVHIFYIGSGTLFFALLYVSYLLYGKFSLGITVEGWAGVMASIWLVGGLIIFSIGVVGVYLSKIFTEVKNRPYTLVRKVYGEKKNDEG